MCFKKIKAAVQRHGSEMGKKEAVADEMQMKLGSDSWLLWDDMGDKWFLKHEQASAS